MSFLDLDPEKFVRRQMMDDYDRSNDNMANNRMWLIHRPSKLGIMLGKSMGWGWYNAPDKSEIERFYDFLSKEIPYDEGSQDDFILAQQDCSESNCFDDWEYTDEKVNGFHKFKIKNNMDREKKG